MGYESESGQEVDLTIRQRQPFKDATVAGLLTLLALSCTALYVAEFKTGTHAPTRASFTDTIQESDASGMGMDIVQQTKDTIDFSKKVLQSQKNVAGLMQGSDNANNTEILKRLNAELGGMVKGKFNDMITRNAKATQTMQDNFEDKLSSFGAFESKLFGGQQQQPQEGGAPLPLAPSQQQPQAAEAPLPPAALQQQLRAAGAPSSQAPAAAASTRLVEGIPPALPS